MKFLIIQSLIVIFSVSAFAEKDRGGGNTVVCKDGSMVLFDYYEAMNEQDNWELGMGPGTTYQQKAQYVLDKLKGNRELEYLYVGASKMLARFESNTAFLKRAQIKLIDDSKSLIDPEKGCKLVQTAVQREPISKFQKTYMIDKALWDKANEETKAGLVLHEIFLRIAIGIGNLEDDDSTEGIRHFNSILARKDSKADDITEDLLFEAGVHAHYQWEDDAIRDGFEYFDE